MIGSETVLCRAAVCLLCLFIMRFAVEDIEEEVAEKGEKGLRYVVAVIEVTIASVLLVEAAFLTDEKLFAVLQWMKEP